LTADVKATFEPANAGREKCVDDVIGGPSRPALCESSVCIRADTNAEAVLPVIVSLNDSEGVGGSCAMETF